MPIWSVKIPETAEVLKGETVGYFGSNIWKVSRLSRWYRVKSAKKLKFIEETVKPQMDEIEI